MDSCSACGNAIGALSGPGPDTGVQPIGSAPVVARLGLELQGAALYLTDDSDLARITIERPDGAACGPACGPELPVGTMLHIGSRTLVVRERIGGSHPSAELDESEVAEVIRRLEEDAAAAIEVLASIDDAAPGHVRVVMHALEMAKAALAVGSNSIDAFHCARLAPGVLLEGVGQRFAGEGRTVLLRKGRRVVPAAFVGLGGTIALTVLLDGGPETVLLPVSGFSRVAAIQCRRITASYYGVEWQYDDATGARAGRDLSMDRTVMMFPRDPVHGLDHAWQVHVRRMLQEW